MTADRSLVEAWSRREAREWQDDHIRAQVTRASQRVPYYRELFRQHGLQAKDIRGLDDLGKIPPVDKEDFRTRSFLDFLAVPTSAISICFMTSGSTGSPVTIPATPNDVEILKQLGARSLATSGFGGDDFLYQAFGYGSWVGGHAYNLAAQGLGIPVLPMGPGRSELAVRLLRDLPVTTASVGPGFLGRLVEVAQQAGIDPRKDWRLRLAIQGGEPQTLAAKRRLESQLPSGFRSHTHYGATEIGGPFVGVSCPYSLDEGALHVWADQYVVEVVDPMTGAPVPFGTEGELVFTTLTREAVPLLRWKSHDLSAFMEQPYDCPCGRRAHPKIRFIRGRTDDLIKVRNTLVAPSAVEEIVLATPGVGSGWQIVYDASDWSELLVAVECAADAWPAGAAPIEQRLRDRLSSMLGLRVGVAVHAPAQLPRYEGKSKRVISPEEYARLVGPEPSA